MRQDIRQGRVAMMIFTLGFIVGIILALTGADGGILAVPLLAIY
ncbi:putative membrane protein YfcA [Glaciimonas immobilis]|uniref:Putative membrane protein YfcA n=1 Tax=Glaciimonas immobilis TaxID=728004 RepID=A0A840RPQ1_9BURK|nr:putative membrane protein YfcA [Glaciimonas immobilis]